MQFQQVLSYKKKFHFWPISLLILFSTHLMEIPQSPVVTWWTFSKIFVPMTNTIYIFFNSPMRVIYGGLFLITCNIFAVIWWSLQHFNIVLLIKEMPLWTYDHLMTVLIVTMWFPIPMRHYLLLNQVPGPLFTKKTPSYQYRDSHYKPETVVRPS